MNEIGQVVILLEICDTATSISVTLLDQAEQTSYSIQYEICKKLISLALRLSNLHNKHFTTIAECPSNYVQSCRENMISTSHSTAGFVFVSAFE